MPATLDLILDATERPTIYPARMHGAACALLGHPEPGGRPRFAVRPPVGHDTGLSWRLGWLDAAPCPRTLPTVVFGQTRHPLVALTVREWSHAELTLGSTTRHVEVDVASPLYFSRGDRDHPAPDAVLAVRSLMDRWDAYAPTCLSIPAADRAGLLATVYLAGFDGRTVAGAVGRATEQTGFVGRMTLALTRRADDGTAVLFTALTRYAEIAGIGAQTGHGFGAVSVHPGLPSSARTDQRHDTSARHGARTTVSAVQRGREVKDGLLRDQQLPVAVGALATPPVRAGQRTPQTSRVATRSPHQRV